MKRILLLILTFLLTAAPALAVVSVTNQGGTGTSSPSGILYGDNGATNHLNTVGIGANLTFSGGILSASGGGGSSFAWPFTPLTNFGGATNATSSPIWFQSGLQASTTSNFSSAGSGSAAAFVYTGTAGNHAASFTSTDSTGSSVTITGLETSLGTLKVQHNQVSSDSGAAAGSFDAAGANTLAKVLFLNSTGSTTGNLITGQNNTLDKFVFNSLGYLGIGSSSPTSQISLGSTGSATSPAVNVAGVGIYQSGANVLGLTNGLVGYSLDSTSFRRNTTNVSDLGSASNVFRKIYVTNASTTNIDASGYASTTQLYVGPFFSANASGLFNLGFDPYNIYENGFHALWIQPSSPGYYQALNIVEQVAPDQNVTGGNDRESTYTNEIPRNGGSFNGTDYSARNWVDHGCELYGVADASCYDMISSEGTSTFNNTPFAYHIGFWNQNQYGSINLIPYQNWFDPSGAVAFGYSSTTSNGANRYDPLVQLQVSSSTAPTIFAVDTSPRTHVFQVTNAGVASSTNIRDSGVPNCNTTSALTTDSAGNVACGAISGSGGAAFPFTPTSYGVSTSTTVGFLSGLFSNGSTTISSLGSGTVNAQNGLLYSTATSSLSVGSPLTVTGTLGALIGGTNSTINCQTASGSQAGCLSSTDWNTFNGKDSFSYPFTPSVFGGTGTSATSTAISDSAGFMASSTSHFQGINNIGNLNVYPTTEGGLFYFVQTDGASGIQTGAFNGVFQSLKIDALPLLLQTRATGLKLGVGTTSPFAKLSIGANNGDVFRTMFAIGSSTQTATSTLFSVDNTGLVSLTSVIGAGLSSCSGGSNALTWSNTTNQFGCNTISSGSGGATEAANWATIAVLSGTPTYSNGTSGVGATLTEVGTGALSVDGNNPAIADRVLVKNQASAFQNGIYTVTAAGSGIAAYILTRSSDYNTPTEITPGITTYVVSGTVNTDTTWAVSYTPPLTIGTTNLAYAEAAGTNGTVTSVGLSSSNSTLIVGSTPVTTAGTITADLNLANPNTWSVLQQFNGNASTTGFTNSGTTWFSGITGSTQCLHVDTNGKLSGTGSDCGAGGGGGAAFPFTPLTNFGVNTSATTTAIWAQGTATTPSFMASSTAVFNELYGFEQPQATSTAISVGFASSTVQLIRLGTSATTITFSTYLVQPGMTLALTTCNPNATAGALTFANGHYSGGVQPGNTTAANQCDMWFWQATMATGTTPIFVLTGQTSGIQ